MATALTPLETRWQTLHARTLALLHRHAAQSPPPLAPLPGLDSELVARVREAERNEAAEQGACLPALIQALEDH